MVDQQFQGGYSGGYASPQAPAMSTYSSQPQSAIETANEERIQEIAEAIIDEKWSDLIKNVELILNWKDTVETRIAKMEEQIAGVKENFDKLHEGILGKVGEYDKNVKDIGVELKALEEVFKRILPGFVENVNELSRITGYLKKKPVAANPGTIPKKII